MIAGRCKSYLGFSLLILSTFFSSICSAWNAMGHMVVAQIAYDHLTPDVKQKVDHLVGVFNKEYPEINSFTQIAYWPDAIRSQKIDTFTHWHYIDQAFSTDGTPLKNLRDTDNAVWAIQTIEPVVQNSNANEFERARFLAFFVHIVGDLHQPLHTVSYISAKHPDGDRGGNDYYIWLNKERRKLHKLWDSGLDFFDGSTSTDTAKQFATQLTAIYPKSYFGPAADDLDPEHWVGEGVNNAKNYVYSGAEEQPAPASYETLGREVSQKEITLAGYRLAAFLNQLMA